ncbi:hypothetical protein EHJ07_00855 [Cronobacter muytjensii]|uniref:Uncharacterized protein n=1 Tax=Cronobacter muytjensii TaxID=413501 RepID=A0A2T7AQ24_9ENTR|nr:hypothetical protein AFK63_00600 [Cronobacter muytjensii ATCC 51329]EGT4340969.1 hypothetical protein [Cronobacter muytjensii]NCH53674.1 hypothetical protein [Cronobacter muytjensii]NCI15064.1 hypothetical protein [Cronobacter muytjensii]PUX11474.1 hypothetical protein AUN14_16035 [Cronobacter muytjensii]
MKTLVGFKALRKGKCVYSLSRSSGIAAMRVKKRQLKEKIEKRVVLKTEIPIMRLHRDGNVKHFTK